MTDTRFAPEAARALRAAIREAGGIEIFAVGEVRDGRVTAVEVHARGTDDQVIALISRARSGQVVVHNHPSGVVRPSEPDMSLAGRFGENGVGFVIVDNLVERALWVVEPQRRERVAVDERALIAFFDDDLPRVLPGWEARPGQLDMALAVARHLHAGGDDTASSLVLEAGTGTGKSLAYLVPSALWALANEGRVVVSTYTRTLQAQLVADDLPLLARVLPVRAAVLKGRTNYACRRKVAAVERTPRTEALVRWAETSATGDFSELPFEVEEDDWESIESDVDQTLRARCPYFNRCFYYQARRAAAGAHLVVVNHALLLADRSLKRLEAPGILPDYDRIILDEAHHLEQAVTTVGATRLSARSLGRALGPVLSRSRRPGALDRVADRWPAAAAHAHGAIDALARVRDLAKEGFARLDAEVHEPARVRAEPPDPMFFSDLADALDRGAATLGAVQDALDGQDVPVSHAQPVLDLQRARRRLEEGAASARAFLAPDEEACRWLDPGAAGVVAARAPIDVQPLVRRLLVDGVHAVVHTSATLAVNGRIDHWRDRVGLVDAGFRTFPSPFDYPNQAILALPRDLPAPDAPGWLDACGAAVVAALEASRGGAFVLCTSHDAVRAFSERAEAALGGRHAILRQGRGGKGSLLERFRKDRGAILFGTDSFWEGVSVRGDGLRLVVIPRLPFRVPTEPLSEARFERIRDRGGDPFRAWSLPEAVLKLRQGFGRLVRSKGDRGAVMVLDRRLHEAWYGRVFLGSLPDARRVVGPLRAVIEHLTAFYQRRGVTEGPP